MTFTRIASLPHILTEITSFYGPCLSAVVILTLSVQTLRDHEDSVHDDLWASGYAASCWEGDRYADELQEELNQLERDRYEHIPCLYSIEPSAILDESDREDAALPLPDMSRPEASE